MDKREVGKAISDYLQARNIKSTSLAKELGVSNAYVSALLSGKRRFGISTAKRWSEKFGFNTNWLIYGQGDMFEVKATEQRDVRELELKLQQKQAELERLQIQYDTLRDLLLNLCEKEGSVKMFAKCLQ